MSTRPPQVLPGTIFVAFYSLLPHKEVRFLFPAIPLFIAGAAVGLAKVRRDHSAAAPWSWRLTRVVLLGHAVLVCGFAAASSHNYPGAHALSLVHRHAATATVPDSGAVGATAPLPVVHIGNLAATSGVSRFGEDRARFQYSKIEHLSPTDLAAHPMHFSWAISEACVSGDSGGIGGPNSTIPPGFELIDHVEAFRGMQARWPFLRLERSMCVLKRGVS